MSGKTRRTVSFRAEVYVSAARAAADIDEPLAAWVETAVREALARQGVDICTRADALEALGLPPTAQPVRRHVGHANRAKPVHGPGERDASDDQDWVEARRPM